MSKAYFDNGADDGMGIFAGYGAGWYIIHQGREYGPYHSRLDAEDAVAQPVITCGGIGVNYSVSRDGRIVFP